MHAAGWAANEAARRRVPLRLVHGVKVSALSAAAYIDGLPPTDFFDALESDGHRYLAEAKAAVRQAHPGLEVDVELRSGNPVRD